MAIVGRLRRGIYAHHRSEVADLPVRLDVDDDLAGNLLGTLEAGDEVGLLTGQAGRVGRLARLELQWEHTHANQVRAVDALVGRGQHGLDPAQQGALGRLASRFRGVAMLGVDGGGAVLLG